MNGGIYKFNSLFEAVDLSSWEVSNIINPGGKYRIKEVGNLRYEILIAFDLCR